MRGAENHLFTPHPPLRGTLSLRERESLNFQSARHGAGKANAKDRSMKCGNSRNTGRKHLPPAIPNSTSPCHRSPSELRRTPLISNMLAYTVHNRDSAICRPKRSLESEKYWRIPAKAQSASSSGGWESNYLRTVDKAEAEHNLDVTLPQVSLTLDRK